MRTMLSTTFPATKAHGAAAALLQSKTAEQVFAQWSAAAAALAGPMQGAMECEVNSRSMPALRGSVRCMVLVIVVRRVVTARTAIQASW